MKTTILWVLIIGSLLPSELLASQYGCTVLLCLANPSSNGGPKGIAECVPTINQLYDDLEHDRPFPTCDLADGNDGSSYAQLVYDPYDPCPASLVPVQKQTAVMEGNAESFYNNGTIANYTFNGDAQISELQNGSARACVGKLLGHTRHSIQSSRGTQYMVAVNVYDQVIWQPWQSPSAINVYIDSQFHNRVHY